MSDPIATRVAALSPLDGRYAGQLGAYGRAFSEEALIRERLAVEVAWLRHLSRQPAMAELGSLTDADTAALTSWVDDFGPDDAAAVKAIEARTNHDVKAVEYELKRRLSGLGWSAARTEFVHFGATSEDINNLAYARMVRRGLDEAWLPAAEALVTEVRALAESTAAVPMLARTHGQPATPTTLGKELAVFVARWQRQLQSVRAVEILGKWGGATGTLAAHEVAYPELDWTAVAASFVEDMGLTWNPLTTQIEPHDWMAELFHALVRFNTILLDFCRDAWAYISLGYLRQQTVAGEVGSSTMPHKVNPIDFENGEANAGVANALLEHLAGKLPISRLQRDLSDSSALRNVGSAFGYCGLALSGARRGLARVAPDVERMAQDLDDNWEVLGEAIQTVMRRHGVPEPYERLKALTRGQAVTPEMVGDFVRSLELPDEAEKRLLSLTPASYVGRAEALTHRMSPVAEGLDGAN